MSVCGKAGSCGSARQGGPSIAVPHFCEETLQLLNVPSLDNGQ